MKNVFHLLMSPRVRQLSQILALMFVLLVFLVPSLAAQTGPQQAALQAFEALRAAEDSGADISHLVSQYNVLLQQQAPDSSYNTLGQLAADAQASALAARNLGNILRIVVVPVTALLFTLITIGVLELRNRLARERLMEMEIEQH